MAIPTIQLTGKVLGPDGVAPTAGTITVLLSEPGTAMDGGTAQFVAGRSVWTLAADGSLPAAADLVPNDAITRPGATAAGGTYYTAHYDLTVGGKRTRFEEEWVIASAPSSLDIGDVTRTPESGLVPVGVSIAALLASKLDTDGNASDTRVTATGSTTARTMAARAADFLNAKDFGAVGDGVADDTTALQAAIDASLATDGNREVHLNRGTYRITSALRMYPTSGLVRGATLVGKGIWTTYIEVDGGATTDGLVFSTAAPGYGYGGGARDLVIRTHDNDRTKSRDLLSLTYWTQASFSNMAIQYPGRNGIRTADTFDIAFRRVTVSYSGAAGLYTTGAGTTLDFDHLYIGHSQTWGADVYSDTVTFKGCIFEYSGQDTVAATGGGVKIRGGSVAFTGSTHFENNLGHDVWVAGVGGPEPQVTTTFSIVGAYHYFSGANKAVGYDGVRVDVCNGGAIVGGDYRGFGNDNVTVRLLNKTTARNVRLLTASNQFTTGNQPAGIDQALAEFPGIFEYGDNAVGNRPIVVGNFRMEPGGGITVGGGTHISKHLSGTATWDPGSVADGAMVSTTVTVTGAEAGDTTAVGFSVAVPAGMLLVGSVTATNTVTVTLVNHTGAPVDLASGTLRADVWQH